MCQAGGSGGMPLLAGGDCHQPSSVVPRPLARWSAARRRREVTAVVVLNVQRMMANRSGGGRGPSFRARIMNASRLSQLVGQLPGAATARKVRG